MKRTILAMSLTVTCALSAYSQRTETSTSAQSRANASASANQAGRSIDIQSGTRLAAELKNTVDVRKAKVGDEVVLKTTHAIKSEGRTVVNKGARLIGHVTEVEQKTKANGTSRIGLLFDRLNTGSLEFPISATIISVTRGRASIRSGDQDLAETELSAGSSSSARSTSSSGGLVGGVGNTVGGVVNNTTSTVGSVVSTTAGAVGGAVDSTSRAVVGTSAGSLGRIQIAESSNTSADGGAVLSLRGDNLRLEKGVTFNMLLNQSANVRTPTEQ